MAQKKLQRFADIKTFSNVLEYPKDMQGQWRTFFQNDNPLILELACGRGEYAVGLAKLFPHQNFIGVDVKGNRIYIGAKKALNANLSNTAFLRTQIEMLPDYFANGEVDEIWITFPDPQLRTSKAKKRLTHPRFLRLYQQLLNASGCIHLKTDSPALFNFTKQVIDMFGLELLNSSEDVYSNKDVIEQLKIKTHYENLDIAQSKKIFYLQFKLPGAIPMKDDELQEILKQTEPSLAS
ncbi:MAG: tRNA (guanosine(46)-N7)-methyltransferase TrmB [Ferruginibacter sp.]